MSRFKGTYRPTPARVPASVSATAVAFPPEPVRRAAPAPPPSRPPAPAGITHKAGFFFLAAYLLAGVVNAVVYRFAGMTTYLTAVCLAALPILVVLNGRLAQSFRVTPAKLWLLFSAWLLLALPTSLWIGGSARILAGYLPRSVTLFFFITSFVATIAENRRLMAINIFVSFVLILNCLFFGSMKSGRLEVPKSLFFENANDLGLALLLAICQAAYLFFLPGIRTKVWGSLVAVAALYFLLKTASRGCFLALMVASCVGFLLSRQKVLFAALGIIGLIAVLIAMPDEVRHRLTFIVSDPNTTSITTEDEMASYGSQVQRQKLFWQSVDLTLRHPIFGVGPGQFAVAMYQDLRKENKHANWLGTHNTYTEISSECGLPALFFYLWIIAWNVRTAFRIYRYSSARPEMYAVAGMSYSLLVGTVAFAIGTFFFHITYSSFLPILSGSVAALRGAVGPEATRSVQIAA